MLPLLEAVLRASPKDKSFEVIDNDPIDADNFLFKLRCELTSGETLQIRLRGVSARLRYSYQELTDRPVRRWDDAPHFPYLANFPHHFHDQDGNVTDSPLTGDPVTDLQQVLDAL